MTHLVVGYYNEVEVARGGLVTNMVISTNLMFVGIKYNFQTPKLLIQLVRIDDLVRSYGGVTVKGCIQPGN